MTVRVHILVQGRPLCGFTAELPARWPIGEIWVRRGAEYERTAAACRNPEHELHCMFAHVMCNDCEEVLAQLPPVTPVEGRTCERCGVELDPYHFAVYCTNECALADAGPRLVALLPDDGEAQRARALEEIAARMQRATGDETMARLCKIAYGIATSPADRDVKLREFDRALHDAEISGDLPEFHGLCFQALLLAAEDPIGNSADAGAYLDMADHVAASDAQHMIVRAAREAIRRAARQVPS